MKLEKSLQAGRGADSGQASDSTGDGLLRAFPRQVRSPTQALYLQYVPQRFDEASTMTCTAIRDRLDTSRVVKWNVYESVKIIAHDVFRDISLQTDS